MLKYIKGFFCITLFAGSGVLSTVSAAESTFEIVGSDNVKLRATPLERFDSAWAMTFLPDGQALVSEKSGKLWLLDESGKKRSLVANSPQVTPRGQGGLGDIILAADFATSKNVYLSYVEFAEQDNSLSGAVVELAKLILSGEQASLQDRNIIWRQAPKMTGHGHYGQRLAISPDGYLFISSGERQKFDPAQNMAMNLGKVIRLNLDGSVPSDNPFYGNGEVSEQIWSLGHRNPLGLAFDANGQLWELEMGPRHGDELNRIQRATNYGYPVVSEGDHYNGTKIPDHASMPIYQAPEIAWVPAISPAGLMFYQGSVFPAWQGDAFVGGLSSQALIRIRMATTKDEENTQTTEAARYAWGRRIREVEEGPNGEIFVLEDDQGGRLLKLEPMP
jgi:aldose sugar dehydrogenase